jgi:hypothetical protein
MLVVNDSCNINASLNLRCSSIKILFVSFSPKCLKNSSNNVFFSINFFCRKSQRNAELPQKRAAFITVTVQTAEVNEVK